MRDLAGETGMRAPRAARAALGLMTLGAVWVGLPAVISPRGFYDNFPFVASWVAKLPPYNEHLVTDVGALYLALAIVAGWGAWVMHRELVRAVSTGWLVAATLHLVFHAAHLQAFETGEAIAQMVSLTVYLLLPVVAIWGVTPPAAPPIPGPDDPGRQPPSVGAPE